MKQVVVIHGGDSFDSDQDFAAALENWPVTIESFLPHSDWKRNLESELGESYQVLQPQMPNKFDAHYRHWKIWFERMFPFLQDEVTLVGHSQGGLFLVKYLSENMFPKKIKGLFLVAPPHSETPGVGDFKLSKPLNSIERVCENVHLYQSKDDLVVPYAAVEFYRKELPNVHAHIFEDRGHFNQETFPELLEEIRKIGM